MTTAFSSLRNHLWLALVAGTAVACAPAISGEPTDDSEDPSATGGSSHDGDGGSGSGGDLGQGGGQGGDGGEKSDDPCGGKACGDSCSVCTEGPCLLIDLSCDADGVCGGGKACQEPSVPTGELCADSGDCTQDQYCDFEGSQDCDDGALGRCSARPDACDFLYEPVCGCDGNTYGNACAAAMAGAQIARSGPCIDG